MVHNARRFEHSLISWPSSPRMPSWTSSGSAPASRPSVDVRNPDIRLHLRMLENEVILSLDAAGDSLHRRGYRRGTNEAPLNEVLAAGLVLLSGWDRKSTLLDPMCGSATILTEAGLLAQRIAPGLFHQGKFGFENWPDFDADLWQQLREEAQGPAPRGAASLPGRLRPRPARASNRPPLNIERRRPRRVHPPERARRAQTPYPPPTSRPA
ncbi:MAG: hypothetical protein WKG07_34795 [Hymenobacter sp.]